MYKWNPTVEWNIFGMQFFDCNVKCFSRPLGVRFLSNFSIRTTEKFFVEVISDGRPIFVPYFPNITIKSDIIFQEIMEVTYHIVAIT